MRFRFTMLTVLVMALFVIGPVLAQAETETVILPVEGLV